MAPFELEHCELSFLCAICGCPIRDFEPELPSWLDASVLYTTGSMNDSGKILLDTYKNLLVTHPETKVGCTNDELRVPQLFKAAASALGRPSKVVRVEATRENGPFFKLTETSETVVARCIDESDYMQDEESQSTEDWVDHDLYTDYVIYGGHLYNAIHHSCAQVLDHYISSTQASGHCQGQSRSSKTKYPDRITSLRSWWDIYLMRMRPDSMTPWPDFYFMNPHKYLATSKLAGGLGRTRVTDVELKDIWYNDPIIAENMTDLILENLEPLDDNKIWVTARTDKGISSSGKAALLSVQSLIRGISRLPTELQTQIMVEVVHSSPQLGLEPDYLLPPSLWRSLLVFVPWLWDLDHSVIALKESTNPAGRDWDWESLVRKLSQPNLFEMEESPLLLPGTLWNRRRIWRLLELAYMGDAFHGPASL